MSYGNTLTVSFFLILQMGEVRRENTLNFLCACLCVCVFFISAFLLHMPGFRRKTSTWQFDCNINALQHLQIYTRQLTKKKKKKKWVVVHCDRIALSYSQSGKAMGLSAMETQLWNLPGLSSI